MSITERGRPSSLVLPEPPPSTIPKSSMSPDAGHTRKGECSTSAEATQRIETGDDSVSPDVSRSGSSSSILSERARIAARPDEGRRVQRRKSAESVAEANGDVTAFLKELEAKRKQLDEQIHKYIASKEREFKLYERELRNRYREAGLQQPAPDHAQSTVGSAHADSVPGPSQGDGAVQSGNGGTEETDMNEHIEDISAVTEPGSTQGLKDTKDPKILRKKETELLGLFTPAFLPLLEQRDRQNERAPSAPPRLDRVEMNLPGTPERPLLQKAQTDPTTGKAKRPARLMLGERMSSNSSDGNRTLVSALKSPSARSRMGKKRVSLVVGDEVVAPSDIPAEDRRSPSDEEQSGALAHSLGSVAEYRRPYLASAGMPVAPIPSKATKSPPASSPQPESPRGSTLDTITIPSPTKQTIIPVPTFDDDLASPFEMDEELHSRETQPRRYLQDDDGEDQLHGSQDEQEEGSEAGEEAAEEDDVGTPSPAMSPEIRTEKATDIPIETPTKQEYALGSIRSSSLSSNHPTSPGFARPSVREDPKFLFEDEEPGPKSTAGVKYDSIPKSPRSPRQHAVGSIGESYMARNAESLMKKRRSPDSKS